MNQLVLIFSILAASINLAVAQEQKELPYVLADTFQSDVEPGEHPFTNYTDGNTWMYVSATDPITITEVDLASRIRTRFRLQGSETRRNMISSLVFDERYIVVCFSETAEVFDRTTLQSRTIPYGDAQYSHAGIADGKLFLYGVYDYHILDGYPMLQTAIARISEGDIIARKRFPFSGIRYTHLVGQPVTFSEGIIYFTEPTKNFVFLIDTTLTIIDSIPISAEDMKDQSYLTRTEDSLIAIQVKQKAAGASRKELVNLAKSFSKEAIMELKDNDTEIYRNEKIYVNSSYILVTRKPVGTADWSKRELYFIDKKTRRPAYTFQSTLIRSRDFQKPIFVNSARNFFVDDNRIFDISSNQFYTPDAKDKATYSRLFDEWSRKTDHFFYTLIIYKLPLH